jgi:3-deoxy-D-manno-octulosonic-acid transferase
MILFLYNLALFAALMVTAPWWLFRMATTHKYREGLRERLGLVRRDMVRQLQGANHRPVIWMHAVSVGEVLAVSRLVKTLDEVFPEYFVAVSTTTRTGQELARQRFGRNRVFYCPLDLPWAVAAWLRALQPKMLVLAETEFWPNLLSGCFRRQIPVVVVNARISDRSWPRYRRLQRLWQPFLSRLAAVLAQSELDAGRLRALGCLQERVTVAGNLKFDVRTSPESTATKLLAELRGNLHLIVAGSTLDGEEAMLLSTWPELTKTLPDLAMVLAPRHPERFAAVTALLERSGFRWRRRSMLGNKGMSTENLMSGEIVLLDSIGELASVYSLASVAFVGGSLVAAGGHNPLEPAQFGVPVVMGEHYTNFRAIVDAMRSQDALAIARPEELAEAIASLLRDPVAARAIGKRGRQVFEQQAGATERTINRIRQLLASHLVSGDAA